MKKCSYCGAEYPDETVECAVDHTPLDTSPKSVGQAHSILGIAAFVISVLVGLLLIVCVSAASILSTHRMPGERFYPGQIVIGLLMLFLAAIDVVALALGIASFFQSGKNKTFGIMGVVFSTITMLAVFSMMILGFVYMSRFAQ